MFENYFYRYEVNENKETKEEELEFMDVDGNLVFR